MKYHRLSDYVIAGLKCECAHLEGQLKKLKDVIPSMKKDVVARLREEII